jgi:hypothetical protein
VIALAAYLLWSSPHVIFHAAHRESGRAGRDRDPVARHADLETASIPTELDFGRYRHAQEEVTDSMRTETVDAHARAAAAVALVRQRAPEIRFLPIAARPVPDHPAYFQVNRVHRTGRALHRPGTPQARNLKLDTNVQKPPTKET